MSQPLDNASLRLYINGRRGAEDEPTGVDDRINVGLALSGGGFRAAAFHLGCLRAIQQIGAVQYVRVLSGVSGGALLGALYAYGPTGFPEFDDFATSVLRRGLQAKIAMRIIQPMQALPSLVGLSRSIATEVAARLGRTLQAFDTATIRTVSRTTALVDVLRNNCFGKKPLSEVSHPTLATVFTACDLITGNAVRFGSIRTSCSAYGRIDEPIDVATAVAASAAFPPLLPALEHRWVFRSRDNVDSTRTVMLTDGGVYDNLGLTVLLPGRSSMHTDHVYQLSHLVACDAGPGRRIGDPGRLWPTRMNRVIEVMHQRAQDSVRDQLYLHAKARTIQGFVLSYLGSLDSPLAVTSPNFVPRDRVWRYPTNFRAMRQDDLDALSNRGTQLTRDLLRKYCPDLCK